MKRTTLSLVLLIGMMTFPSFSFGKGEVYTYANGLTPVEYDFAFEVERDASGEFYAILTEVKEGLKELVVPDSVEAFVTLDGYSRRLSTIPMRVVNCTHASYSSLENVVLGQLVESVEAFKGIENLKTFKMPGVKKIGSGVFLYCQVEYVEITGMTEIRNNLFYRCGNLKTVVLSPQLKSIGNDAFMEAKSLTSIEIPQSVKSIGSNAFKWCDLHEIVLPEGLQTIGKDAFSGNEHLKAISIPASVRSMKEAFAGECPSLESLTVDPANDLYESSGNTIVEKATKTVVQGCSLSQIPEGIERIGAYAFDGSANLSKLALPESLCAIEDYAFCNCASLRHAFIPKNVNSIGNNPFDCCSHLETIEVAEENTSYDSREGCHALVETATGKLVSGGSKSTIPEGVKTIGTRAFNGNEDLTSITLPASFEGIGIEAFYRCSNLKDIYSLVEYPNPISDLYVFGNMKPVVLHNEYVSVYADQVLHVLPGTRDRYCQTAGWCKFQAIFEDIGNPNQVEAVPLEENSVQATLFDLSGRQLQKKPAKGLYIQNGKLMLSK